MAQYLYFPFYPHYIKKEDTKDYLLLRRRISAFVVLGMAIIMIIIELAVLPMIFEMYQEFNINPPPATQLFQYLSIIILIASVGFSINLLATSPDYESLEVELKRYKKGEMIQTSKIVDFKKDLGIILFLGLFVGSLVLTVIMPVYNLTSRF